MRDLLKTAAAAGLGAVRGFAHARHVAHAATRVPVVGHILGAGTLVAGTVMGAAEAAKKANGE